MVSISIHCLRCGAHEKKTWQHTAIEEQIYNKLKCSMEKVLSILVKDANGALEGGRPTYYTA